MWAQALLAFVFSSGVAFAQLPASLKVEFPKDGPVRVADSDWSESRTASRGGVLVFDIRAKLRLVNTSARVIRGISLVVESQAAVPGGRGSVMIPSLNVTPGESFAVPVRLRLLHPLAQDKEPAVRVLLDGVLFDDLSFYGPDRFHSRRSLLAWELQARYERAQLARLLQEQGPEAFKRRLLANLSSRNHKDRLSIRLLRGGSASAVGQERQLELSLLRQPEAPLELTGGSVLLSGNLLRQQQISLRNNSTRRIRYFEIGWLIRDSTGRWFQAGVIPAPAEAISLEAGNKLTVKQDLVVEFRSSTGEPMEVSGIRSFIRLVEFADGSLWVADPGQLSVLEDGINLGPGPEEERLTELYRQRGLEAVIEELRKLHN